MRRFSEKILNELARATEEHPGLQSKLNHRAKAWGFEIDVLLDPLYEAAFAQEGPFTPEADKSGPRGLWVWSKSLPLSQLADKLVYLSRERDYAGHSSDGFVFPPPVGCWPAECPTSFHLLRTWWREERDRNL